MLKIYQLFLIFGIMSGISAGCDSQPNSSKNLVHRKPCVAGMFYPSDSSVLLKQLEKMFAKADAKPDPNLAALIVPHAGYVYSGEVAATGFAQIDPEKQYENIFLIGSSHQVAFEGASVYNIGNFISPLGEMPVDIELADLLISKCKYIKFFAPAHADEHSIEVQIPFLQFHLHKPHKIVPIIIGNSAQSVLKEIATALKPWFNDRNLFVISTDFSHYPSAANAVKTDEITANAIQSKSPEKLLQQLKLNQASQIPNLHTSLCGQTSVLILMYLTESAKNIAYQLLKYQNSGKTSGDASRVVGYHAISVSRSKENPDFDLTLEDETNLLKVARFTLEKYLDNASTPRIDSSKFSESLLIPMGAFVTLRKKGELRGCIGRFTSNESLYKVVQEMTISAAIHDHRFSSVKLQELKDISIEISVLSPMHKINSINEIELGKHGIYIKKGMRQGTFLPKVATEQGFTKDQFLGYCSRDKAGIGWDGWKNADIYIYQAHDFSE